MRTVAEIQPAAAEAAGAAPAARRSRGVARAGRDPVQAEPASAPAATPPESPAAGAPAAIAQSVAVVAVRLLRVEEGLYCLRIGAIPGRAGSASGVALPAAQVTIPFSEGGGPEIVAAFPRRGPWLSRDGGTVILRSPPGGGHALVTAYADPGEPPAELAVELERLDGAPRHGATVAAGAEATAGVAGRELTGTREVQTEILLHIERAGDRLFPGRGWVGALGRRMRIEAFSVRPLERLPPADIELKGYMPNGGETPWIPGGVLCGTRGRGLPLTGLAIRIAPQHADRFEVQYQGSFFAGGISETRRNGEACRSGTTDDPLEAINIRLIELVPEDEEAGDG